MKRAKRWTLNQFNRLAEERGQAKIEPEIKPQEAFAWRFEVSVPPSVNHYLKRTKTGFVKTAAAVAFQNQLAGIAKRAGCKLAAGKITVFVALNAPASAIDCDNCLKLTLDALIGVAYFDDSQVQNVQVERFDENLTGPPHIAVAVSRYERRV